MHQAHDGGVGHRHATLGHHLHQISEAELEAQVPPHAQDDDLAVKVPTLNSSSKPCNLAIAPTSTHPMAGRIGRPPNCTRALSEISHRLERSAARNRPWAGADVVYASMKPAGM